MTSDGKKKTEKRSAGISWRKKLLFTSFALLFVGVVFECVVRIVAPKHLYYPRYLYQADPHMGYRFRPNFTGRLQHEDYDVEIAINSLGFRDSEVSVEKEGFRILALGDSATMGVGLEAEEIFWSHIEEKFPHVEVVNAGMGATGTLHQLALYENYGRQLNPDLVVLLYNVNDADDNAEGISRTVRAGYVVNSRSKWPLFQVSLNFLADHSRAFMLVADRVRRITYFYSIVRDSDRARIFAEGKTREKIANTQELLKELYHSVTESGSRFAVMFTKDQWHDEYVEWLETEKIPTISLEGSVLGSENHFPIDQHWNAKGNELVAEAVAGFLTRENLIPVVPAQRIEARQ